MTATISTQNPPWRFITGLALLLTLFSITGCGGTKVYNSDKTLVLHGDMFNVSKFEYFSSKVEGALPNGDVVDLQRASKSDVNGYLKQGSPIRVTTRT
jgi:hypothetical protein